jgi:hypothetical protein
MTPPDVQRLEVSSVLAELSFRSRLDLKTGNGVVHSFLRVDWLLSPSDHKLTDSSCSTSSFYEWIEKVTGTGRYV